MKMTYEVNQHTFKSKASIMFIDEGRVKDYTVYIVSVKDISFLYIRRNNQDIMVTQYGEGFVADRPLTPAESMLANPYRYKEDK